MRIRGCFPMGVAFLAMACDRAAAPPASGDLDITTATIGVDAVQSNVLVDGVSAGSLEPHDSMRVRNLSAGEHTVLLEPTAQNCAVDGTNPRAALVAETSVAALRFQLTCTATSAVIEIATATDGLDVSSGYSVAVDGGDALILAPSGRTPLSVSDGSHLLELRSLAANCSVAGDLTRTVTVRTGAVTRDTARVAVNGTCTSTFGIIDVALGVSGVDLDDAFAVTIGNTSAQALDANSSMQVRAPTGQLVVRLSAMPSSCAAVNADAATITVASSTTRRDTAHVAFQLSCTPSPLIAFSRDGSIVVAHPDGSNVSQWTDGYDPSWAPDGARLVFSQSNCDFYYCSDLGLSILDLRTGHKSIRRLTNGSDLSAAWSPTGSRIAFVRNNALHVIKPDGSALATIALPVATRVVSRPTWSPDASRLAFGCMATDDYQDICVVGADGGGFARLTGEGQLNMQPAWSPSGNLIAFVRVDFRSSRDASPAPYVAVMRADGSGVQRLGTGTDPAWSPDGALIVFRSAEPLAGLATIRADGTGLTRVTSNANDSAPAWRP
ncbi:MAG TPA: hypothetical protein VKH19_14590 [Gemmatimonadaceae bacterium]|nr:hypothetical protein [Gemmatimonadaceae bacterium]